MPRRKKEETINHSDFVVVERNGRCPGVLYPDGCAQSFDVAVDKAGKYINRYRQNNPVAIYKLVALVKAKEIPVDVDTVMKGEK